MNTVTPKDARRRPPHRSMEFAVTRRPFDTTHYTNGADAPRLANAPLPLDIDIGAGVGQHAITYAQQNSGRNVVAIEWNLRRFSRFGSRLQHTSPIPNLLVVRDDAIAWITRHLRPESVARYFLLYPTPYSKGRLQKRHWHAMPFFSHLRSTLRVGGHLNLATNQPEYAAEAEHYLVACWKLHLVERRRLMPNTANITNARTPFEKKYLLRGESCYDLLFEKRRI